MQIQTIGGLHLVLYIDKKELRSRGLTAGELGLREVLLLTREACQETGTSLGRIAEIEAYPEGSGVLVFICLDREETEWFRFGELPQALDGLQALRQEPDGTLVWYGGSYFLSAGEGPLRAALSEFGTPPDDRTVRELEEDGTLVLDSEALKKLWKKLRESAASKPEEGK